MSQPSKSVYALRFLVVPIWSISALIFWLLLRIRLLVWLTLLPDELAKLAIAVVSQTGFIVFVAAAIGGSSLLLWQWLTLKPAASVVVLMPVLLLLSSLFLGKIDTQGTDHYVLIPAQQGNLQHTREQLVIKMAQYQLNAELQALIRVGTAVNVRNPEGQTALYWARELEQVKPLLQAGAKPDAASLLEAVFWGRVDTMQLLFAATPDDGKVLVAAAGDQALRHAIAVRASGEQDRNQMAQLLIDRGAKLNSLQQ